MSRLDLLGELFSWLILYVATGGIGCLGNIFQLNEGHQKKRFYELPPRMQGGRTHRTCNLVTSLRARICPVQASRIGFAYWVAELS